MIGPCQTEPTERALDLHTGAKQKDKNNMVTAEHLASFQSELEQEFAKLLDKSPTNSKFEVGQIIRGRVIQTEKDGALVDVGSKAEAYLPFREIVNKGDEQDPATLLEIGKEYEFYTLKESTDKTPMFISYKRVAQARGWVKLEEIRDKEEVVEGEVISVVKGGVVVEVHGVRGFVPSSQMRLRGDATGNKGDAIQFKILEMDKRKNKLILSQKQAVDEEKADQREKALTELEIGQVVSGEVVRVAEFGAFVDIGGIDGLLPVSEISWQRISHPKEVLNAGDKISVKILKVDRSAKKISLSLKRLQADPWSEVESKFAEGQVIKGKVVKLAVFGAFVEIYPGVEALLPTSEISAEEEDPSPDKYLKPGEEIEVLIKRFSPYERRISLSLKDIAKTAD